MKKFFYQKEAGFTLIELIIVFTIFAILSGVGIASFVSYSQTQAVDNSMRELKTTLLTARSRALSQLKDASCGSGATSLQLLGYQVVLCSVPGISHPTNIACNDATNAYELQIVCGNADGSGITATTVLNKKFIDPQISFSSSSTASYFFFSTITASVTTDSKTANQSAVISGYSHQQSVSISQAGVIQ